MGLSKQIVFSILLGFTLLGLLVFPAIILKRSNYSQKQNMAQNSPVYQNIRKPAVAGQFYPNDKDDLKTQVNKYLQNVKLDAKTSSFPRIIIVPHAGYDYSGQTAAYSFAQLMPWVEHIKTIFLIGPSHYLHFQGVSVANFDAYQTPLGFVPTDKFLIDQLLNKKMFTFYVEAHQKEHALEVELPFLQEVSKDFKIVPLIFGSQDQMISEQAFQVLKEIVDNQSVVVISSDFSHYPESGIAEKSDLAVVEQITKRSLDSFWQKLKELETSNIPYLQTALDCKAPVAMAMQLANLWNLTPKLLYYTNSGKVTNIAEHSVGYVSLAWLQNDYMEKLTEKQGKILVDFAKRTIEAKVKNTSLPTFEHSDIIFNNRTGLFVSLKKNGKLRGSIGHISETNIPIKELVAQMAVAVAKDDYRFPPVQEAEFDQIKVTISILDPLKQISKLEEIRVGEHGVYLKQDNKAGVFLPQVWQEMPDFDKFMEELCSQKAGLEKSCYKDKKTQIYIFTAQVFS